jgi:hypothetical protein
VHAGSVEEIVAVATFPEATIVGVVLYPSACGA